MDELSAPPGEPFAFNAGRLCLDFANTVRFRPSSDRLDLIGAYEDLLGWARQATILTPGEAATLADAAHQGARAAGEALTSPDPPRIDVCRVRGQGRRPPRAPR